MSDREAFEKWAKGRLDLQHIGVCYGDDVTEAAWQAWQAAQDHKSVWTCCECGDQIETGANAVVAWEVGNE